MKPCDVTILYANEDSLTALKVEETLSQAGFSVSKATDLPFAFNAIESAKVIVIVPSKYSCNSITSVLFDIASKTNKSIISVSIDHIKYQTLVRNNYSIDFSDTEGFNSSLVSLVSRALSSDQVFCPNKCYIERDMIPDDGDSLDYDEPVLFERAVSPKKSRKLSKDILFDEFDGNILSESLAPAGAFGLMRYVSSFISHKDPALKKASRSLKSLVSFRPNPKTNRDVYSSVYAPSQIKKNDWSTVQVFLHNGYEADEVAKVARMVDSEAEIKNYSPLQMKLESGDKVEVSLQILSEGVRTDIDSQEMVWTGTAVSSQFNMFVPEDYSGTSVTGVIHLSAKGVPVGRMTFKSDIKKRPVDLNAKINVSQYKKVFISYSQQDSEFVDAIVTGYKALGNVNYFMDRDKLNVGELYKERIYSEIDSSDLFILCWSKNAAASAWVDKERHYAMSLYEKSGKKHPYIYPLLIKPYHDLPEDMASKFQFGKI